MYNPVPFIFHSVNDVEITGMYSELIKKNEKMPDPRAGSTPVLSGTFISSSYSVYRVMLLTLIPAYSAACLSSVNITVPPKSVALTLPSDWDGPDGMSMGLPAAILTVITTAFIGVGGIWIICSM